MASDVFWTYVLNALKAIRRRTVRTMKRENSLSSSGLPSPCKSMTAISTSLLLMYTKAIEHAVTATCINIIRNIRPLYGRNISKNHLIYFIVSICFPYMFLGTAWPHLCPEGIPSSIPSLRKSRIQLPDGASLLLQDPTSCMNMTASGMHMHSGASMLKSC